MCRNIRTLANFEPPATHEEIHNAALQFVRKISGTTRPSKRNAIAFDQAVDQISEAAHVLITSLETASPPRDRAVEATKAKARSAARYS